MSQTQNAPLIALVLSAFATLGCGGKARPAHPEGPLSLTLQTVDGQVIDLRALRGRPVVLHVFATWSLTAQGDLSQLVSAHEERAEKVTIIGVALDLDGPNLVAPWQRANGISYPIVLSDEALRTGRSALGRIVEVPTTIILRADGRVAHWLPRPLADGELLRLLRGVLPSR